MGSTVAVIGAGLIGRAWAIVFARAGVPVRLFDVDQSTLKAAREAMATSLHDLEAAGLISASGEILDRVTLSSDLHDALQGADYVQECGPENTDIKRSIYSELERHAYGNAILASSTSGIVASEFTGHLERPWRCLVAHPVNPPYLVPLVEVVPGPQTAPEVVERTMALMRQIGQKPIHVRREIEGFVLNRLQGALLTEALRLFQDGYVSAEDIDKTVKDGLGLRWSFMGALETIDLNAPGGVVDYARRYGPLYTTVDMQRTGPAPWNDEVLAALETELRRQRPAAELPARQEWRDRRLMALVAHKQAATDELGS